MKPVTLFVHPDEKAMSLREQNMVRPPTHQWHRYQIVTVNRGDELAEWWRDLGPSENFPAPGCEIPALWEHTVGELWDIAQHYRLQDDYWRKTAEEIQGESTLIPDFLNQYQERNEILRNRSRFGPGYTKQRNGFPKEAISGN